MTQAIYEPKGKAREYAPLACNLYSGCTHGCTYCYAPACLHRNPKDFHAAGVPRPGILVALAKDADRLIERSNVQGTFVIQPVLFCFSCDPYQQAEETERITRQAVGELGERRIPIRVLTKNPQLALRDLDLFKKYGVEFGVSCVWSTAERAAEWEPNANTPSQRQAAIRIAKRAGVYTWVSVEPVVDPAEALDAIRTLAPDVDKFKVGPLNHRKAPTPVDWTKFLRDALTLLEGLRSSYYIKDDLWAHADQEILDRWPKTWERRSGMGQG
ncbi:MAG: radical SAM protein [Bryobacteraceae bacterium]